MSIPSKKGSSSKLVPISSKSVSSVARSVSVETSLASGLTSMNSKSATGIISCIQKTNDSCFEFMPTPHQFIKELYVIKTT